LHPPHTNRSILFMVLPVDADLSSVDRQWPEGAAASERVAHLALVRTTLTRLPDGYPPHRVRMLDRPRRFLGLSSKCTDRETRSGRPRASFAARGLVIAICSCSRHPCVRADEQVVEAPRALKQLSLYELFRTGGPLAVEQTEPVSRPRQPSIVGYGR